MNTSNLTQIDNILPQPEQTPDIPLDTANEQAYVEMLEVIATLCGKVQLRQDVIRALYSKKNSSLSDDVLKVKIGSLQRAGVFNRVVESEAYQIGLRRSVKFLEHDADKSNVALFTPSSKPAASKKPNPKDIIVSFWNKCAVPMETCERMWSDNFAGLDEGKLGPKVKQFTSWCKLGIRPDKQVEMWKMINS